MSSQFRYFEFKASIAGQIIDEIIEACVNDTGTIDTITTCGDSVETEKEIATQIGDNVQEQINETLERDCDEFVRTSVDDEISPDTTKPNASGDSVGAADGSVNEANVTQILEDFDEEMDIIEQLEGLDVDCYEGFVDGAMPPETMTKIDNENEATITQFEEDLIVENVSVRNLAALERDCDVINVGGDDIDSTQSTEGNVAHDETCNDKISSCSSGVKPQSESERVAQALRSKGFATSYLATPAMRKICNLFLLQNSTKFTQHHVKCEGFPATMTDHELILLFEKCGQVFILKRIRDGLMFVTYTTDEDANRAVDLFNYRDVRGRMVTVERWLPLCRIIVRGISPFDAKRHLLQRFTSVTTRLQSVEVFNDALNENRIRRFCYLTYSNYEDANEALKRLNRIWPDLNVEFANQQMEWTKTPDTLYISNLRSDMSKDELLRLFCVYGKIISVTKSFSFAKIQFGCVEDAKRAANRIDKRRLGNENVDISFLKMYTKRSRVRHDRQLPCNMNQSLRPSSFDIRDRNSRQLSSNMRDQKPRQQFFDTCDQKLRPSTSDTVGRNSRRDQKSRQQFSGTNDQKLRTSTSDTVGRTSQPLSGAVQDHVSQPTSTSTDKAGRKSRRSSPVTMYLKNLRPGITAPDLRKLCSVYGEVILVDKEDNSALVQFRKKKNAQNAAEGIDKSCLGDNVRISFAEQTDASDTLHIYNVFDDMTTKRLRTIFTEFGEVMDVELRNGVATVGFRCKTKAERAMKIVNKSQLGKGNVKILFYAEDKH